MKNIRLSLEETLISLGISATTNPLRNWLYPT